MRGAAVCVTANGVVLMIVSVAIGLSLSSTMMKRCRIESSISSSSHLLRRSELMWSFPESRTAGSDEMIPYF